MKWHNHSSLKDAHAFLSPSNYHWLNYDDEKLVTTYRNVKAKELGTRLHALAKEHIDLGIKMPNNGQTLNMHINDAIGYRMDAEVILVYSNYCFGTADAIGYNDKKRMLRIHDLKTGSIPASMKQLYIYAAVFFLEYGDEYNITPEDVKIELRIYQNDDVVKECPAAEDIRDIMDDIVHKDYVLRNEV